MSATPRTPSIASQVSRRRFLRDLGIATGCVATGATLLGCEVSEVKVSGGGDVTELAFNVTDAKFVDLKAVGKMVAVNVGGAKLLLIRTTQAEVIALSRICPHAACDLSPDGVGTWKVASSTLHCGCHNSEFKPDGKYVADSVNGGGKVGDLDSYPVTFDAAAGTGIVDLVGAV